MLTAWGDESGSDRKRDPNTYILGAIIADEAAAVRMRENMRSLLLPGQRKVHWRVESDKRRDLIIDVIAESGLNGVVVARTGLEDERDERRRRKCFVHFSTRLVYRGPSS